jgi:hypothetical protein
MNTMGMRQRPAAATRVATVLRLPIRAAAAHHPIEQDEERRDGQQLAAGRLAGEEQDVDVTLSTPLAAVRPATDSVPVVGR